MPVFTKVLWEYTECYRPASVARWHSSDFEFTDVVNKKHYSCEQPCTPTFDDWGLIREWKHDFSEEVSLFCFLIV